MITIETLTVAGADLDRAEVEHWIQQGWVRADPRQGTWVFHEIDVARLSLLRELRQVLGLQEDALPVVLRILDQLYDERRRLRRVRSVIENLAPAEMRAALLDALRQAYGSSINPPRRELQPDAPAKRPRRRQRVRSVSG